MITKRSRHPAMYWNVIIGIAGWISERWGERVPDSVTAACSGCDDDDKASRWHTRHDIGMLGIVFN